MEYEERFSEIRQLLSLNFKDDEKSAEILDSLLNGPDLSHLEKLIQGKICLVFGCGPSLREDFEAINGAGLLKKTTSIAADGAVSLFMEKGVAPEINVSDLDGKIEDIIKANRMGTVTVIHAHGDNKDRIKDVVPQLKGIIFGSTQTKKFGKLHNFGGFTDGDRAVFLASHFKAKAIVLAGMDFGKDIGEYSYSFSEEDKKTKLELGKKLIEGLAEESDNPIQNFTSKGEEIVGVGKIKIKDLSLLIHDSLE
ncbi:6-hydroxymethylpterin diphosphokinase MptE-like protein [Candidatus Altiarchaeota archaeon]